MQKIRVIKHKRNGFEPQRYSMWIDDVRITNVTEINVNMAAGELPVVKVTFQVLTNDFMWTEEGALAKPLADDLANDKS